MEQPKFEIGDQVKRKLKRATVGVITERRDGGTFGYTYHIPQWGMWVPECDLVKAEQEDQAHAAP